MSESVTMDLIFREYQDKVSRYIRSRINNYHDAEDLASDVFLKVAAALDRYNSARGSLSTWIYAITRNAVRDYHRRAKPGFSLEEQENLPDDTETVDDTVIRRERLNELALALERLSARERDIIILRFYQGLSPGEIARKMNISYCNEGFIQSTALKKLRKLLDNKKEEPV
ncbi:MAG: sigma-70 family RNA polymerase sigma factor [Clostridiales bacterium]|jgi:RNA polymerase sigma-70 factor (ECF subfamily)|nr:sigma-70 family RNA polymerase sigma factor [Eubacteriales bacterium]NLA52849.1 sigma-70 family RNA polymerase sigma factor [Clostridiales bacterium]NLO16168.1 sigma-70 family RNA polymerase sigma factor [Clostridiales bacterium]